MTFFDKLLDATIYFSFDRSGFLRHSKKFSQEKFSGSDKTVLITGANAGIGYAATESFCKFNAAVHMVCRNTLRGEKAIMQLRKKYPNAKLTLHSIDMSDTKKVAKYFSQKELPLFDIVVNNAGSMPETVFYTEEGEELTWATHVVGHYILIETLKNRNLLAQGARVITVSSGGMYLQKLNLKDLQYKNHPYNKYNAYANAKRAQVILNDIWHNRYGNEITFSCMHPGWVATKGVSTAMQSFYSWMQSRLRTPEQGADTIVWLALTKERYPGGKFWFDRAIAPKYKLKSTRESPDIRKSFENILKNYIQK